MRPSGRMPLGSSARRQHCGSRLPTRFNEARRKSPGSQPGHGPTGRAWSASMRPGANRRDHALPLHPTLSAVAAGAVDQPAQPRPGPLNRRSRDRQGPPAVHPPAHRPGPFGTGTYYGAGAMREKFDGEIVTKIKQGAKGGRRAGGPTVATASALSTPPPRRQQPSR